MLQCIFDNDFANLIETQKKNAFYLKRQLNLYCHLLKLNVIGHNKYFLYNYGFRRIEIIWRGLVKQIVIEFHPFHMLPIVQEVLFNVVACAGYMSAASYMAWTTMVWLYPRFLTTRGYMGYPMMTVVYVRIPQIQRLQVPYLFDSIPSD